MEIGSKIKRLRMQRGLTQEELADRCELSKGFISLLERDLTSPSIATLVDILECLGSDPAAFFSEKHSERKIVFTVEDTSVKIDEETMKGSVRWLVPDAQKNRMEPILVELGPEGVTASEDPHEGEEFGFVLSGTLQIELGERKIKAHQNESFYFEANEAHRIANVGKGKCRFLWVSTPPSF